MISQQSQRASSASALRLSLGHLQYLSQMISASVRAASSMHSVCSTHPDVTALPHTLQFGILLRLLPLSFRRVRCSLVLVTQVRRYAAQIPGLKAIVACSLSDLSPVIDGPPVVAALTARRFKFALLFHCLLLLASLCIFSGLVTGSGPIGQGAALRRGRMAPVIRSFPLSIPAVVSPAGTYMFPPSVTDCACSNSHHPNAEMVNSYTPQDVMLVPHHSSYNNIVPSTDHYTAKAPQFSLSPPNLL